MDPTRNLKQHPGSIIALLTTVAMCCTAVATVKLLSTQEKLRNANEFVSRCLSGQPLPTDSKDSDFYCRIEVRSR